VLLLALALVSRNAHAAVTGSIEGTVTDQASSKKLAGVTVTVTSPALQGEQTEFTDADGHYIITELPPGEYLVRFYFSNINVERPGVFVQTDKTLSVNVGIPTQKAEVKTYRITEKAPTVDVGNTQQQTAITNEFVRNTPVRGRTYDAVLTLAPGSGTDPVGFSFNGATGPENNFLIDGINTTDPAFGLLGTQMTLEFIGETEIITGGYNAEYGRATGGVVNVITKSGSNQFHGDLWFYVTPFQLPPSLIGISGAAIAARGTAGSLAIPPTRWTKYQMDVGFDLGGPILKDKIWFYVGFQPTLTDYQTDRLIRARTATMAPGSLGPTDQYQGDLSATANCPSGLQSQFCSTPGLLAPGYVTQLLPDGTPGAKKHYEENRALYNWIVKLNFQLNANNSLVLQYIGSPETRSGPINAVDFNQADSTIMGNRFENTHDAMLHFVSKLADRRLQLDIMAGYHYDDLKLTPDAAGKQSNAFYTATVPLAQFEMIGAGSSMPCASQTLSGGATFLPCPVSNYQVGGWGFLNHSTVQRISAMASATYFARLGGTHALKLGFDFEDNIYADPRNYTGGAVYEVTTTDQIQVYREYASKGMGGINGFGIPLPDQGFNATTQTLNYGAYLRDSYNVGFIPGLTINAGVRYEAQQVKATDGTVQIGIYDNWAPRVGAIYDFTRKGRSKIFASYGWFYESIPLDINDRQFSGEGLIANLPPGGMGCTANAQGVYPLAPVGSMNGCAPLKGNMTVTNGQVNGGTFGQVMPGLKGMYSEEVVAGIQYDVGLDLVLGASYIHRDLGRIIEDMSPDGGIDYIIANPGATPDQNVIKDLQNQISTQNDPTQKLKLQQKLNLYQNINNGFPKAVRNYDALVVTATKRLSHNFLLLASYTYSRTLGNYPGTYQASNGQLDPNISTQYDLRELLYNRSGPLPNDRPHNLKISGSYLLPFGANTFVFGAAFNAYSGVPIEVLGQHPFYGISEVYILPRGSGGRTPFVTQLDLHVSYRRQLSKLLGLEAYWDIFNLANEQAATLVDPNYTYSVVAPIQNGTVADLQNLKTTSGTQPLINPNYGQPIAFQQTLSMRFGLRLSF
jgi:hypothetical protein